MRIILFFIICLGMLTGKTAPAQTRIKIGQAMPALSFDGVWNTADGKLTLQELKGKWVILDFWTVYCKSCIAAFPHMQELQDKFGDHLQVILVTNSPEDKVKALFERRGLDQSIQLPMIAVDTVLTRLFEFRTVPTHAWIDPQGKLAYFTNGYGATEANLVKALAGETVNLPYKKEYRDFDSNIPIYKEGNGRQLLHLRAYSMVYGHIDDAIGTGLARFRDSVTGIENALRIQNQYIAELYRAAWADQLDTTVFKWAGQYGEFVFEVDDPKRLIYPETPDPAWVQENTYSYEAMLPPEEAGQLMRKMRHDLDEFFRLETVLEEREVPCLVLTYSGSPGALRSNRMLAKMPVTTDTLINLTNGAFQALLYEIVYHFAKRDGQFRPLVNETGIGQWTPVDMELKGDLTNFPVFQQVLASYQLELKEATRRIKVLVFRDQQHPL